MTAPARADAPPAAAPVLELGDGHLAAVATYLEGFGLTLECVAAGQDIPGSYWGAPEAGLVGATVYVRADTPVHSALHEACHAICMDEERRTTLKGDAGGDFDEENAVCCLQILIAAELQGVGAERLMADMDAWGYTFRLGSARAWFEAEADEPRRWLQRQGLLDARGRVRRPTPC